MKLESVVQVRYANGEILAFFSCEFKSYRQRIRIILVYVINSRSTARVTDNKNHSKRTDMVICENCIHAHIQQVAK